MCLLLNPRLGRVYLKQWPLSLLERAVLCQQWASLSYRKQHRQCSRLGGDFRWPTACSHDTFHLGRRVVCVCGELSHTLPRGTVAWAGIGGPGFQAGEFLLSASCEAEGSGEWGEGGHIGLFPPAMSHLKRGNQSAQPLLDQVFASIRCPCKDWIRGLRARTERNLQAVGVRPPWREVGVTCTADVSAGSVNTQWLPGF